MEIEQNGYKLRSDGMQYWIEKFIPERVDKNGKKIKEQWRRVTGYYRYLKDVYADFINRKVLDCEAKTFGEAMKEMAMAYEVAINGVQEEYKE